MEKYLQLYRMLTSPNVSANVLSANVQATVDYTREQWRTEKGNGGASSRMDAAFGTVKWWL